MAANGRSSPLEKYTIKQDSRQEERDRVRVQGASGLCTAGAVHPNVPIAAKVPGIGAGVGGRIVLPDRLPAELFQHVDHHVEHVRVPAGHVPVLARVAANVEQTGSVEALVPFVVRVGVGRAVGAHHGGPRPQPEERVVARGGGCLRARAAVPLAVAVVGRRRPAIGPGQPDAGRSAHHDRHVVPRSPVAPVAAVPQVVDNVACSVACASYIRKPSVIGACPGRLRQT